MNGANVLLGGDSASTSTAAATQSTPGATAQYATMLGNETCELFAGRLEVFRVKNGNVNNLDQVGTTKQCYLQSQPGLDTGLSHTQQDEIDPFIVLTHMCIQGWLKLPRCFWDNMYEPAAGHTSTKFVTFPGCGFWHSSLRQ